MHLEHHDHQTLSDKKRELEHLAGENFVRWMNLTKLIFPKGYENLSVIYARDIIKLFGLHNIKLAEHFAQTYHQSAITAFCTKYSIDKETLKAIMEARINIDDIIHPKQQNTFIQNIILHSRSVIQEIVKIFLKCRRFGRVN